MPDNHGGGTPVTIIFTLIISFIGFFAVVTCVTLFYYKRGSRRSERLEQNQVSQGRESFAVGGRWLERPVVWEVWVDKHPKPAVQWDDLLPLNFTYDHDQLSTRTPSLHPIPTLPAPRSRGAGWRSLGVETDPQLRPREPNDGPQPNPDTTDCNVSVFIAMPTPHGPSPPEFGGEFAIGTAEVVYRHPVRRHS